MMTTSFASSLEAVCNLPAQRQVLSLMHRHATDMTGLRTFLTTHPDVSQPVRNIALSSSHWQRLHTSALKWSDPDSLPARALELCRAIVVRVLRTPDSVFDDDRAKAAQRAAVDGGRPEDYMPKRPADWDGGVMHTRLRMLTALVGIHQLQMLSKSKRPYTNLRNFALTMNVAPKGQTVKARLDKATDRGLLMRARDSEKGNPGVWVVRSLGDRSNGDRRYFWPKDAPLSVAEEAIAQALYHGDESNFAAALILNADHVAFHYEPDGLAAWWLLARTEADPFHPVVSDEEERFLFKVRSMADVDALVSDEARAEKAARIPVREAGKAERKASADEHSLAWKNIHKHLAWDSLSKESTVAEVEAWSKMALTKLRDIRPERPQRVEAILRALRPALPKTLPGQGDRAFLYLERGLSK